jgi:DNA-binding transcriptional MerR regulator
MSAQETLGHFGIGEVLAQLRPEFPDISTSKIRFLEAEGLIEPARTRSGYRRFSAADIERLRHILTMQRDSYLPLRVIRERLAMKRTAGPGGAEVANGQSAGRAPADMTRRQLLDAAEISEAELTELEDYGLIRRWWWPGRWPRCASTASRPGTCARSKRPPIGKPTWSSRWSRPSCGSAARARGTRRPGLPGRSPISPCGCTRRWLSRRSPKPDWPRRPCTPVISSSRP